MANFGIGLGAFTDGLFKGIGAAGEIKKIQMAEDAALAKKGDDEDRKRLRDFQFTQLEQEANDRQGLRDIAKSSAADAETARGAAIQGAMTPGADGTWKVGDQTYASEAEATAAAEKQTGSFMDFYMKTSVPQMQKHWAANGQPEKAQALGAWMEDENVKKGAKAWAGAVRSFQTGDREGFKRNLMGAYNQEGYFDDGSTATAIEDLTNDKGQLTGYRIKFKDAAGVESEQEYTSEDVGKMALNAMSPAQVFSFGLDQIKAGQTARAEAAKEERGFQRDVQKIGIQHGNTLESQANASQLRSAEEAEKLRTGGGSKKVVEANAIAAALKANGKDDKYIQLVYPQLLGVERESKSETDRLDGYIATMGKSDLDFAGLPASQQVARAREMMQAVDDSRTPEGATSNP